MRNSSALSANMAYRNPWNGGESHRPVNTTSGGSTVKVCQFVNHVIACYPNQAGWEVSTQQARLLAVTPKADSYRPDIEVSKSALLTEESEPSDLAVVVNAASARGELAS